MSVLPMSLELSWKVRAAGLFLQCRRACCTHAHLLCVSRRECARAGTLVNFETIDLIIFFWNVLICQMLIIVKQHILRRVVIKTAEGAKPSIA